ncbi:MAG: PKD domain-containing protein [Bacteroidia bacterium]
MKLHLPIRQRLKVIGLLFLFGMSCGVLRAQNPLVKQWDKRFGGTSTEYLRSFQQTTDLGYILGGYSDSKKGGDKSQGSWGISDYWVVKIDSLGIKQWDRRFGGNAGDFMSSLQQTVDGGYILGGWSASNITGNKTQLSWGSNDFWIIKIDSQGNKQWDKDYGGTDNDALQCIKETTDGGFILGGWSYSGNNGDKSQPSWGNADFWIIKVDSIGIKQWDKRYGGSSADWLYSLQQTTDGGYILGGKSSSPISGDKTQPAWNGYSDYWIVKIDSIGNKQWDKCYGGVDNDVLISLKQTTDGGYILGGASYSGIGGDKTQPLWGGATDYWIVKVDSFGNKQWDKDYGGNANEDEFGNISQTSDGGYLIAGTSYSPISGDKTENNLGTEQTWVIKTDSIGNKQWDKTTLTLGHEEIGLAIQTNDGGYAIANFTYGGIGGDKTQPAQGADDYWIIKFWDTIQVTLPTIYLSCSDTSFCEKHCLDFFDLSTNNPTSWQWSFPGADSTTSTLQNPTNICYNQYGSFDVTLIACNAAGCDTLVLTNFINAYPLPSPVIFTSFDTLFSSLAVTYQWWSVTNGLITGATNNYFIPSQVGDYFVIVTDSTGCAGISDTVSITAVIPSINLMSTDTSFCEKHCLDFFDLSTNNPTSWQWFFPGADSATSPLQYPTNICYNNYGSFDVTLIACNAAGCDTLVLPGFINEYPAPTPTITQSNDTLFSSPGVAYQWWSVDSGIIAGANNYYYIPTHGGSYYVIVTDTTGCEGASNTIVIMGINEEARGKGQMAIVPNPNDGNFTIILTLSITKDFSLHITNPLGQTISKRQEARSKGQNVVDVNMESAAKGPYLVEVINGGKVYRGKVMVQ